MNLLTWLCLQTLRVDALFTETRMEIADPAREEEKFRKLRDRLRATNRRIGALTS